ncbi:MAG TPA: (d)CMP kinase [Symbiobacteriaceae bacterium]|nr:(d)CMP kinase [Symbiobacteriaceae bacterium]
MTLSNAATGRGGLIIAIDGPAGAGKSTLAKTLAERLGYLYVDTGAMYRALALKAIRKGIDVEDHAALTAMAAGSTVRLERGESGNRVFLDGHEVTEAIREPEVERVVSRVSAAVGLRQHMIELQRSIARQGGVVMDGRDIGSYVLPDADVKFFLTASLTERAQRRQEQLASKGRAMPLDEIVAEIARRDEQDRNKGVHSLIQTPDSNYIDTTGRTVDDVMAELLSHCRRG